LGAVREALVFDPTMLTPSLNRTPGARAGFGAKPEV